MHIGIIGPIATADISHLLDGNITSLPQGYAGAPLLATLIEELLRRGHRVTAFTLSRDMEVKRQTFVKATGANFSINYCPMRPRAWRFNGRFPGRIVDLFLFERRVLESALRREVPDIIHAHWCYEFALAALATKIPHVITCHDSPYAIARIYAKAGITRSAYRWLRVLMAKDVLRNARYVTTVSPYMQKELRGLSATSIALVPNPVDHLSLSLARVRQVPVMPRIAMICNGWNVGKNPEPALLAFAKLRRDMQGVELHLFGSDFGFAGKAETWCTERGITDGMAFHGAVPHYLLIKSLASFDLLIHPSLEESFGMVVAESMAMGIPVVAGESSGAVPWVVGNGGVLCDVKREAAIYAAISEVLNPNFYSKYSEAAQQRAADMFAPSAVASAYLRSYNDALMENFH